MIASAEQLPRTDDLALMRQAQEGDRQAFNQLWARHERYASRIIKVQLGNFFTPERVKDILQTTATNLFKNLDKFDSNEGGVNGWINTTTTFACSNYLDHLHTDKRKNVFPVPRFHDNVIADPKSSPEDRAIARIDIPKILNTVEKFSEPDKTIIIELFINGKTQREVANQLGYNEGHFSRLKKQAVQKLLDIFPEYKQ